MIVYIWCLAGDIMYMERLNTLKKMYKLCDKSNKLYLKTREDKLHFEFQLGLLLGINQQLKQLNNVIIEEENEWRRSVLNIIESEIISDLAFVYPEDFYQLTLSSRIVRNKIHIEATVKSVFCNNIPGRIKNTQGRLFQQIVSFAALKSIMNLLGINSVYIDEAFSGAAKDNIKHLNKFLSHIKDEGFNIILIAQNMSLAEGIDANRLLVTRSIDNETSITQEVTFGVQGE